jgi:Bacterial sugar transferase
VGHLIIGTALAAVGVVFAIFVSVAGKLGADEFKAWAPWLTERLIDLAVARLPEDQRGRYAEEWRSHVSDVPGDLSKIFAAARLMPAARTMLRVQSLTTMLRVQSLTTARAVEIAIAGFLTFTLLPHIVLIAAVIKVSDPRLPVLLYRPRIGHNGKIVRAMKFRTIGHDVQVTTWIGHFLQFCALDDLPVLFSVLRGDMPLRWPR